MRLYRDLGVFIEPCSFVIHKSDRLVEVRLKFTSDVAARDSVKPIGPRRRESVNVINKKKKKYLSVLFLPY